MIESRSEAIARAARGSGGGERLVVVRLNRRRVWRWQVSLVQALARSPGCRVEVAFVEGQPIPAAVDLLLRLERLVFRVHGVEAADLVPFHAIEARRASSARLASLVIDLAGGHPEPAAGDAVLQPLYCGHPDDLSLVSALLARSDVHLGFAGCGDAHFPATDSPDVLTRALGTVFGTLLRLCLQRAMSRAGVEHPLGKFEGVAVPAPAALPAASFALRTLGGKVRRRLVELCRGAPRWRVGWRMTDEMGSLGHTQRLPTSGYRALPDDGHRYYADPFLLAHGGRRILFVEELPLATGKGLISAAEIAGDGSPGCPRPVLELETHASYPFVFQHGAAVWMIPETSSAGRVDLYRAERVPDRWEHVATILDDVDASDVTLTRQGGLWWMFAATRAGHSSNRDTLCLYSAQDLLGPWVGHPANPVLVDRRSARPGGALFRIGGALWRPAQDASLGYGSALSLCRVDVLTRDAYAQTLAASVRPAGSSVKGLHTLNFDGRLEVVDGLTRGSDEWLFRLDV